MNPRDLNFSIEEDAFPVGFYKGEVRVKEQRHLIFATGQQLMQLAASKSWYVDGTFNLVSCPFQQLLSINAFVFKWLCQTSTAGIHHDAHSKEK